MAKNATEKVEYTDQELMDKAEAAHMQETDQVLPTGLKFRRTKAVVTPILSLKGIDTCFLRFDGEIYVGEKLPGDEPNKPPAHLAPVTNLETGEQMTLIVLAVLESVLSKAGNYVGKSYEIGVSQRDGKKYKDVKMWEIEIDH